MNARTRTKIDLNESEIDLNESEINLNESEIDLNEYEQRKMFLSPRRESNQQPSDLRGETL